MKKNIGWVIYGVVAVVLFLGFMNIQARKKTGEDVKKAGAGLLFPDMMNQLSRNMALWGQMSGEEKKQAVGAVITIYKNRDNIAILNSPEAYIARIEETLAADPAVLNIDIMTMVRILAIMDYDYYNGQNKDALARETLGERAFAENQLRRQRAAAQGL